MKLLMIGPFPPPVTGVSLANKVIFEELSKGEYPVTVRKINTGMAVLKEDVGKFSFTKLTDNIKNYKHLNQIKNCDILYITPGQTFFGIVKYAPYIYRAKLAGKEIILHIHGDYLWRQYEILNGIRKKIFAKIIQLSGKGIVLSHSLRRNMKPFLPDERIFELPNFVEDDFFDIDPEKKLRENFDSLRIIYLSNLMKEKGILDLLDALQLLKNAGIEFRAKIAGGMDTAFESEIEYHINKLRDNVTYLGIVRGGEKRKLLEWGNTFVFPTFYQMEGQPIAILEAMATANIILTTPHGGIPDIISEENGLFAEKRSPQSLSEKLILISKSLQKFRKIAEHNRREALDKYRVSRFVSDFVKILKA